MDSTKRQKLEAAGHTVTTVDAFLDLSPAESALVEARLALADALRSARTAAGLTQAQLARRVDSTQARISKAENADASVSTDLLLKAIFGTGASPEAILSRRVARHQGIAVPPTT